MKLAFVSMAVGFMLNTAARAAPSVHLNAGESHVFSDPSLIRTPIAEFPGNYFYFHVEFAGDLLSSGDSLRVDVLSSPTQTPPLATFHFSSPDWSAPHYVGDFGQGYWDVANGAISLTMVSGSVDVTSVLGGFHFGLSRAPLELRVSTPMGSDAMMNTNKQISKLERPGTRHSARRPTIMASR